MADDLRDFDAALMVLKDTQAQLAAMTAERDDWQRFALIMDKCRRTMWRQVEEERKDAAGVPRLKPTTTRIPIWGEQGDTDGR